MEENNVREPVTVTKTATAQAQKIQELMNQGMTLEEALTVVTTKVPRSQIDRVALIKSMTSLVELRKARKTAYAKKSKSKDHPEAVERYQKEIEAASDRLNELIASINSSETPWLTALQLGDTPDGALQYFITSLEQEVQSFFETAPFTKSQLKSLTQNTRVTQDFIPRDLLEPFQRRLANRDQRIQTLAARYSLMRDFKENPDSLKAKTEEASKVEKAPKSEEASKDEKAPKSEEVTETKETPKAEKAKTPKAKSEKTKSAKTKKTN